MEQFEKYLDHYAQIAVENGIALEAGEGLIIRADIQAAGFVNRIVEKAYQAGAIDVDVRFTDEANTLTRYQYGRDEVFEYFPEFMSDAMVKAFEKGYSFMSIMTPNPTLLKTVDPKKLAMDSKTSSKAMETASKYLMTGRVKRTIVALPTEAWAKEVFPDLSPNEGVEALWQQVFRIVRADQDNPQAAWQQHDEALKHYVQYLNNQKFDKLHYQAPGTDLEVGLAANHLWVGGSKISPRGHVFFANIPTEEVFTTPDRMRVNGTLKSTKPLLVRGQIVDQFSFTFKDGKVVDFTAEVGSEVLERLLDNDEGARYLGEMALVPHSSPISQSGLVFSNTLFDENASCHFALGKAYAYAMVDGSKYTAEELLKQGANQSFIHVDFMVGSADMSITGIKANGEKVQLFEKGEWVI